MKNTYRLGTEIDFVHFARVLPSPVSDYKASQSNKVPPAAVKEGILAEGCVLRGSLLFSMSHFWRIVFVQSAGFNSSASTSK